MIVTSVIDLKAQELSQREWEKLFGRMLFIDNEEREVRPYRILKGGRVRLPRGSWSLLPSHVTYDDRRVSPGRTALRFTRELDAQLPDKSFEGQKAALAAMIENEQGLVIAQPGFGKTNVALAFAAQCETPVLVVVHTIDILEQWVTNIEQAVPDAKVGIIQGPTWKQGDITVAMRQTITEDFERYRRDWAARFGCLIIDEAHHSPAETWEQILNVSPGKYRFGFTATKTRADGMHPLMRFLIGPVIYEHKTQLKVPTKVQVVNSDFRFPYRGRYDWTRMLNALVTDKDRNRLIADTALRQIRKGQSTLVLSRRVEHLNLIAAMIDREDTAVLTGKVAKTKRIQILDDFRAGKVKCLLATQLADEALDVPILSRVILTHPGKHDGRIIQQVGRALREHETKHDAVIFDIYDEHISVLRNQFKSRKLAYGKMGISVKKYKEEVHNAAVKRRILADQLRKRIVRSRLRNDIAARGRRRR